MIKSLIKSYVNKFLSNKIWIILLIYTIYTLYLKNLATTYNLTYWEFIVNAITDHYYLLYFMIISFIFLLFNLYTNDEESVWIRSKKFHRYFFSKVVSIFLNSTLFVIFHVLIALIMGIGLRFENLFTVLENESLFVLSNFQEFYSNPLLASCFIIIYLILGLTFLGILFVFLNHFLDPKYVIFSIIIIYLMMLISIRTDIDLKFPYLFLNNYIILHHAFAVLGNKFYYLILLECVSIVGILLTVKKFWFKKITFEFNYSDAMSKWNLSILMNKFNLIVILGLLAFLVFSTIFTQKNITFFDLLTILFYGHGTGYFNFLDFLRLVVYNGIPIYLLSYFLEKESINRSFMIIIRLKKKKHWFSSIMRSTVFFLFSYILVTLIIAFIASSLFNLSFNGYNYMIPFFDEKGVQNLNTSYLLLIIISSKFLELFITFLIIFSLFCYTKTAVTGFIVIVLSYLLCLVDTSWIKYFPIGLSSLARLEEFVGERQGISYFHSIGILGVSNLLLFSVLQSGLYQKCFNKG
ncbi:hypothetical protein WQ54_15265 [Bacillus sp. SA1-12]|uniref:hypothetical protein n=1 Tax=Bacillus sp. SA1-12 TaxID=1455638 RepID=UPI00062720BE|nr:hypothetical protein [Bacillus sp. SA1-12]KKI91380.1 hypothetical protein WQ54_15265 [Bacillus sp. SA1-12]